MNGAYSGRSPRWVVAAVLLLVVVARLLQERAIRAAQRGAGALGPARMAKPLGQPVASAQAGRCRPPLRARRASAADGNERAIDEDYSRRRIRSAPQSGAKPVRRAITVMNFLAELGFVHCRSRFPPAVSCPMGSRFWRSATCRARFLGSAVRAIGGPGRSWSPAAHWCTAEPVVGNSNARTQLPDFGGSRRAVRAFLPCAGVRRKSTRQASGC